MQTLLAKHCEAKNFHHATDPLPGAADGQYQHHYQYQYQYPETVTTFTYRTSLVKIDERNFELSW